MKDHAFFEEMLPLYVAGELSENERNELEAHLQSCAECQVDLAMWKGVSSEIQVANQSLPASAKWADQALQRIHAPGKISKMFTRAWQLFRAQAFLVKSDLWPVSALIMLMGIVVALIAKKEVVIYFLSPLVAASTLAVLYGPEHDPAIELSRSTATSPWKILFARLSIVSIYNLMLSLVASLALLFIVPPDTLAGIIIGWFGPLAFLSSLALLLSIWLGTSSAIAIAYSLWLLQYIPFSAVNTWTSSPVWVSVLSAYKSFWQNPLLLITLAIIIIGAACWSVTKPVWKLTTSNQ